MKSIKSPVDQVHQIFKSDDVWIVGGAVRDRLLGRRVTDFDFVVPSHPQKAAEKAASRLRGSAFQMDEVFGVWRVTLPDGIQLDFAKIQGKDFNADLARRDFTVNALAVPLAKWIRPDWKRHVIDRYSGLADLKKKRIVLIAPEAFRSDPLRMLRAHRLSAELNLKISPQTHKWIKTLAPRIKTSAPERIREEMLKLFSTPESFRTVQEMEQSGLLERLLPEIKAMRAIGRVYYGKGGVLRHSIESLMWLEDIFNNLGSWFPRCKAKIESYLEEPQSGFSRAAHLKWAVLLHDIGKPDTAKVMDGRLRFFNHEHIGADKIPGLSKRFRWSSYETDLYARMVRHHMRTGNLAAQPEITTKAIHRFFRDLGNDAVAMLLVSLGDHLSYLTPKERSHRASPHEILTKRMINQYYLERQRILPPRMVSGHDIMKRLKLKPSPLVGALLREATEAQVEGRAQTKAEILSWLETRLPTLKSRFPDEA